MKGGAAKMLAANFAQITFQNIAFKDGDIGAIRKRLFVQF